MKRFASVVFVMIVMALTVWATEIQVFTGSASSNNPLHVSLTTLRDGDVSVRAQWVPKSGTSYVLHLKRLADPNDTFSYTHICQVYTEQSNEPPPGDWTCTIPNGPSGFYTVDFRPTTGKTNNVVLTVTAETDE
jgi:hypothetical protein